MRLWRDTRLVWGRKGGDERAGLRRDAADRKSASRSAAGAWKPAAGRKTVAIRRQALYRMLHKTGNPTYSSFMGILGALGLRIGESTWRNRLRNPNRK
jgi:hypothetical protein